MKSPSVPTGSIVTYGTGEDTMSLVPVMGVSFHVPDSGFGGSSTFGGSTGRTTLSPETTGAMASSLSTLPPAMVHIRLNVSGSNPSLMKRTLPSHMMANVPRE